MEEYIDRFKWEYGCVVIPGNCEKCRIITYIVCIINTGFCFGAVAKEIRICVTCKHILEIILKKYKRGYYTSKMIEFVEKQKKIGAYPRKYFKDNVFNYFFKDIQNIFKEITFELKLLNLFRIQRLLSKECEKNIYKRLLLNLISVKYFDAFIK